MNLNLLWAQILVEEFIRCGITRFVISPGSRSTPLVLALSKHPQTQCVVHFDERGAGFYGLGYGRATGQSAVLVCTSGSAVANYFPAVVEASLDGVPLILLTADRPFELWDVGANQTMDQVKIFGSYVRWFGDLPCPSEDFPLESLLTTVDHMVSLSMGEDSGPVHLNCHFRKPLHSSVPIEVPPLWKEEGPYTKVDSCPRKAPKEIYRFLEGMERGLVVLGRIDSLKEQEAAREVAELLGWPVVADVTSGLRLGGDWSECIPYAEGVLGDRDSWEGLFPDGILHLGEQLVSLRLLDFLKQSQARSMHVSPRPKRMDPARMVTHRLQCAISEFAQVLQMKKKGSAILESWKKASKNFESGLEELPLGEEWLVRKLTGLLPKDSVFYVANSSSIRHVNTYGNIEGPSVIVGANRGTSGIDGTLATACGFAEGHGKPLTILTGDLAFLHDLNSLALLSQRLEEVRIVILNNDGGGLFQSLPIAEEKDVFRDYWQTPHGLQLEHAGAFVGWKTEVVKEPGEFPEIWKRWLREEKRGILEVYTMQPRLITDRFINVHLSTKDAVKIAQVKESKGNSNQSDNRDGKEGCVACAAVEKG